MKQTVELMYNVAIHWIKHRIEEEKQWYSKLIDDNTANTIIEYRNEDHNLSEDEEKLDELCEEYFRLVTEYKQIQMDCIALQSNLTGDTCNINTLNSDEKTEPTEDDLEDVELASDEEILEAANLSENI